MFMGEYSHSLDGKGRLIIPSKFRPTMLRNRDSWCVSSSREPMRRNLTSRDAS